MLTGKLLFISDSLVDSVELGTKIVTFFVTFLNEQSFTLLVLVEFTQSALLCSPLSASGVLGYLFTPDPVHLGTKVVRFVKFPAAVFHTGLCQMN